MLLPIIDDAEDCAVYPGAYTLDSKTKRLLRECRISDIAGGPGFPVNMEELDHEYRIDIALPGQKRENILIDVRPTVLDISLISPFKDEFITSERHITVPPETDPGFANAHYENGMLTIYVPKGEFTVSAPRRIVVY